VTNLSQLKLLSYTFLAYLLLLKRKYNLKLTDDDLDAFSNFLPSLRTSSSVAILNYKLVYRSISPRNIWNDSMNDITTSLYKSSI